MYVCMYVYMLACVRAYMLACVRAVFMGLFSSILSYKTTIVRIFVSSSYAFPKFAIS